MQTTPRDEQETVISYQGWDNTWHFSSNCPKHIRKWRELVTPNVLDKNEQGAVVNLVGTITGANVQIAKQRVYSTEQRKKMAEQLARYRKAGA